MTTTDEEIEQAITEFAREQEEAAGRRLLLTKASGITMRPVHWAWHERIPNGSLTVVPGREGIGKSLFLAWLTAQITRGLLPGCFFGTPRPVIYAATEDSWSHTIGPRLYAAGADLDAVYRVNVEADGIIDQLTLPVDTSALAREISRLGVALLAADPLLSLIHAGIDTHRDRDLRTALEPLARLADETKCAVVGLAHFNKSASNDALNLITGSRAFSAVARAVLAVARDSEADDGSCVLSQAKNNLGRLDLPSLRYVVNSAEVPTSEGPALVGRLEFTGETDRSVNDILGDAASLTSTDRGESTEATRWLTVYMAEHAVNGEVKAGQVQQDAEKNRISKSALQRARKRLGVATGKSAFGAGWVWTLPPEDAAKVPKVPAAGDVAPSAPSAAPSAEPTLPFEA
jgi:hypothetical protein